jgi:hypothetical protein
MATMLLGTACRPRRRSRPPLAMCHEVGACDAGHVLPRSTGTTVLLQPVVRWSWLRMLRRRGRGFRGRRGRAATHIVFTYSLLMAIQGAKLELSARDNIGAGLAEDELETLSFFRQRGSQFLLMSGIAGCIEIIMGGPVPRRSALSFGERTSAAEGRALWRPVVEVLLPFTASLRADELKGSLRNRSRVDDVLGAFRAVVRSTARSHEPVFAEFRDHVTSID